MTTTTNQNDSPSAALAPRSSPIAFGSKGLELRTFEDVQRFASVAARSGFFVQANANHEVAVAQLCIKIQWGAELGLSPITSVQNVYFIDGRMSLSAGVIAALIFHSARARYVVKAWDKLTCVLEWFVDDKPIGESSFTLDDAKLAGVTNKTNWRSYPKAMLFARTLTQGARAFAPFVFMGPIYCPEELGSEGTEDVVDLEPDGTPKDVGVNAQPRTKQQASGSDKLKRAASNAKKAEAPIDTNTERVVVIDADAQRLPPDDVPSTSEPAPEVDPFDESVSGARVMSLKEKQLLESLRSTPTDGDSSRMIEHLGKWKQILDEADNNTLKAWARSRYHLAKGTDEMSGLTPEQQVDVTRVKSVLAGYVA